MAGIIATIIAAVKRHYTFAWVIGIWTAIAIILLLCGQYSVAIAPGWLFLCIAIGMKKIPKESNEGPASGTQTANTTSGSVPVSSAEPLPANTYVVPSKVSPEDEPAPSAPAIRFCRYCGQELENGAKFCRHCGANIE